MKDAIEADQKLQREIDETRRNISKYTGLKAKLDCYNESKEWKDVKKLALISNPCTLGDIVKSLNIFSFKTFATTSTIEQIFKDVKAAELRYDYHHVNTPDLQEVIDCIRDALMWGIEHE